MLTKLTVYDPSGRVPDPLELPLNPEGRLATDIVQVSNIEGLGPVAAAINISPYGSIDGTFHTGSNVADRNIVVDFLPKPDWNQWDIAAIRNHLYKYFTPKSFVRLEFESTDRAPVEILGHVETCEPNIFSKDNETQVSIICPYPHFKAVNPISIEGNTEDPEISIVYEGSVDTGFNLKLDHLSGPWGPNVQFEARIDWGVVTVLEWYYINVSTVTLPAMTATEYIEINTETGQKYVKKKDTAGPNELNLLNYANVSDKWPILHPGINKFTTIENGGGTERWILTYYEKYGGL